jgi:Double zinc ribbon
MPMPQKTCPTCKLVLDLDADVQGRWLTCPRCLTSIEPAQTGVTEAPLPRPIADAAEREARSVCPNCGRDVERSWRFCPNCEEPLRGRRRRSDIPELELDVRRDNTGSKVVGIVLGCLLIGGVVLILFS